MVRHVFRCLLREKHSRALPRSPPAVVSFILFSGYSKHPETGRCNLACMRAKPKSQKAKSEEPIAQQPEADLDLLD